MIHPHTELRFISPEVGFGVFATERIPKGTIMWTLCLMDRQYSYEQFGALPEAYQAIIYPHAYTNATGKLIFCWDAGRYMNHACQPNCLFVGPFIEIAVCDILPGEQITCEYGALNACEPLVCFCGNERCRQTIQSEDVLTYGILWDAISADAFHQVTCVSQLLYPFIQDKVSFEAIVTGAAPFPTQASLYFPTASRELKKVISL